jgi:hypothetical protein
MERIANIIAINNIKAIGNNNIEYNSIDILIILYNISDVNDIVPNTEKIIKKDNINNR